MRLIARSISHRHGVRQRRRRATWTCLVASLLACATDPTEGSGAPSPPQAQQAVPNTPVDLGEVCVPHARADDVLLDLGHADAIGTVALAGDRLVTSSARRWILWDVSGRRPIASAPFAPESGNWPRGSSWSDVTLRGTTLLVSHDEHSFDVRDARDGRLRSHVDIFNADPTIGLSIDGRYAYSVDYGRLRIWSLEGELLAQRSGLYQDATVFAAAETVQVLRDVAHAVEVMDLAGNTLSEAHYRGQNARWFGDGRHFVTDVDEGIAVYSASGAEVRVVPLPRLAERENDRQVVISRKAGGFGDFVWLTQNVAWTQSLEAEPTLQFVQRLSDPSDTTPLSPSLTLHPGRSSIALTGDGPLRRLDLRGREVRETMHALPWNELHQYADDGDGWAASLGGRAVDGTGFSTPDGRAPVFGCAGVRQLVASESGRIVAALADGTLRVREPASAEWRLERTLRADGEMTLSADGRYLYMNGSGRLFALPGGELVHHWAQRDPNFMLLEARLAANGERLARRYCAFSRTTSPMGTGYCTLEVTTNRGEVMFRTPTLHMDEHFAFSPSGRRIAHRLLDKDPNATPKATKVFEDDRLVATIDGVFEGWIDDERLLVTAARRQRVVDVSGTVLQTLTIDQFEGPIRPVDGVHMLSADTLYRVADGAVVAHEPYATSAAIAGNHVLFLRDGSVLQKRFR